MTDRNAWFDKVEEQLAKLAHDSGVKPINIERMRMQLLAVGTTLDESGTSLGKGLADHVRLTCRDLSTSTLHSVIDDTIARWEALKVAVLSGPPEALAIDDELAVLASDPEMASMFVS